MKPVKNVYEKNSFIKSFLFIILASFAVAKFSAYKNYNGNALTAIQVHVHAESPLPGMTTLMKPLKK